MSTPVQVFFIISLLWFPRAHLWLYFITSFSHVFGFFNTAIPFTFFSSFPMVSHTLSLCLIFTFSVSLPPIIFSPSLNLSLTLSRFSAHSPSLCIKEQLAARVAVFLKLPDCSPPSTFPVRTLFLRHLSLRGETWSQSRDVLHSLSTEEDSACPLLQQKKKKSTECHVDATQWIQDGSACSCGQLKVLV